MNELKLAVYSNLEAVFGYPGRANYVGFFWSPFGDEFCFDDGYCQADTTPWGYLAWRHHLTVDPVLKSYDFGSSESEASHWLVLGRKARKLYVATAKEAQVVLQKQPSPLQHMPPKRPRELVEAEVETILRKAMRMGVQASGDSEQVSRIRAEVETEQRLLECFKRWLNTQLTLRR